MHGLQALKQKVQEQKQSRRAPPANQIQKSLQSIASTNVEVEETKVVLALKRKSTTNLSAAMAACQASEAKREAAMDRWTDHPLAGCDLAADRTPAAPPKSGTACSNPCVCHAATQAAVSLAEVPEESTTGGPNSTAISSQTDV